MHAVILPWIDTILNRPNRKSILCIRLVFLGDRFLWHSRKTALEICWTIRNPEKHLQIWACWWVSTKQTKTLRKREWSNNITLQSLYLKFNFLLTRIYRSNRRLCLSYQFYINSQVSLDVQETAFYWRSI